MGALIWLVAGILLASAELFVGELTLFMLGLAALTTAGAAYLYPSVTVELVVFSVSALATVVLLKPLLHSRFMPAAALSAQQELHGKRAIVLETVDDHNGQIKIDGEIWSARSFIPTEVHPPGTAVDVMSIDGPIAFVSKGIEL